MLRKCGAGPTLKYSVLFSKENMRCEQVRGEGRPSYLLYFDNCACLRTRLRTRNQSIRLCVVILWVGHIHSGTGHDCVSSPPRLPCRSPGPGPSVPSPSCPEPRLSRVPKLTPAHNTPHEAIPRLFYPQAAPATDSYFTHDQAQPHQSTALLRVAMDHHLTTQAASGSPLHSALFQPSRARPQQHAVCEIQQRPNRPVESAADAPMQLDAGLN